MHLMTEICLFLLIGLAVGVLGGMLGIGGAIIVVPLMVYVFLWPERLAQGTTLIMLLPPVSLLAVWTYYKAGQVDLKTAIISAICFLPAAEVGANLALSLPPRRLSQVFGAFAILMALRLLWQKDAAGPGDTPR
jgi:uncharacterized membrane protein YfcA